MSCAFIVQRINDLLLSETMNYSRQQSRDVSFNYNITVMLPTLFHGACDLSNNKIELISTIYIYYIFIFLAQLFF